MRFIERNQFNRRDLIKKDALEVTRHIRLSESGDETVTVCEVKPLPGQEDSLRKTLRWLLSQHAIELPDVENNEEWSNESVEFAYNPEKLTNLLGVVREFKRMHGKEYEDGMVAKGSCFQASLEFINLGKKRGLISDRMLADGEVEVMHVKTGGEEHAWVRFGRINIDWTARQFDKNAFVPHVWIDANITSKKSKLPL